MTRPSPSPPALPKPTLQTLFGITLPIIQAPMAGVQGSALAAAVSNAGGLGSLPAAMLSPAALRRELLALQAATDRPYNVNFFCHEAVAADPVQLQAWRSTLHPFRQALDLDDAPAPGGVARHPFSADAAALLAEYRPAVVSFHFGLPSPALLASVKAWGAKVLASATTVDEARWLHAHGADAVIAQGLEAGGHRGHFLSHDLSLQMGTLALLPQVVRAVPCPVIAAGGIADADGVAAALALGASGVQVGTGFLLCDEATTPPLHRSALQQPGAAHTALTTVFTGRPARGIVNRVMAELGPLHPAAPPFPWAAGEMATLRAAAEARGSADFSPLWAGQNTQGCQSIPAAALLRQLAEGCPA
jgi:nitronate monooxygenase